MSKVTEALLNEGIVELDAVEDALFIDLIAAYKEAKDAETAIDEQLEKAKEALNKEFISRGITGKGEVRLNGKKLLSRSTGVKKWFDRATMFRLAPKTAAKAERETEYFQFNRPKG